MCSAVALTLLGADELMNSLVMQEAAEDPPCSATDNGIAGNVHFSALVFDCLSSPLLKQLVLRFLSPHYMA